MSTRTSLLLLLCSAILMACFPEPPDYTGGGPGPGPGTPDAGADPCTLKSAPGKTGGFPYDFDAFKQTVLPPLRSGCEGGASCHGPGVTRFVVYLSGQCPDEQTFNEVFDFSDYTKAGAESVIVTKTNGTVTHVFPASSPASMEVTGLLESYVDAAKTSFENDGGGGGGFDAEVFADDIQEIFDDGGCLAACHNTTSNLGLFGLTPMAFPGSPEMQANFEAVVAKIQPTLTPDQATMATVYVKATTAHSGSNAITNSSDLTALESWIADGLTAE